MAGKTLYFIFNLGQAHGLREVWGSPLEPTSVLVKATGIVFSTKCHSFHLGLNSYRCLGLNLHTPHGGFVYNNYYYLV